MLHRPVALASLLVGGLASCFQAPSPTQVVGCAACRASSSSAHGGTGGRSSSRASGGSSSASSGSSGSSGAPSSSSSSSGAASSLSGSSSGSVAPDGGGTCLAPLLPIDARVYDLSTTAAVAGAQVSALDQNAVPIGGSSTTSRSDGTFTLCVPANIEITPEIQAAGYPTTYLSNFSLTQPMTAFAGANGIPLLSTTLLLAFGSFVPVGNVSNLTAVVLMGVESASRTPPCVKNSEGWTFELDLADGGVLPDGGAVPAQVYYIDSNGFPTPTLTATSSYGLGLFFNVDTSLTSVMTAEATSPDAGPCSIELATFQITGRLYTSGGAMTIVLLPSP